MFFIMFFGRVVGTPVEPAEKREKSDLSVHLATLFVYKKIIYFSWPGSLEFADSGNQLVMLEI